MRTNDFRYLASGIAVLHLTALSLACGPWHWGYLTLTVVSGALLGMWQAHVPRQRGILLICATLALSVQQATFWLWKANLGAPWWPLAQFASVHFLMGLGFRRLLRRSPRLRPFESSGWAQGTGLPPQTNNRAARETEPALPYDE